MSTSVTLALIITTGIVITVVIDHIKTFLLKREQIKADAIIKTEEIRAKNQLEIEKLIRQDQSRATHRFDESDDKRTIREKIDS